MLRVLPIGVVVVLLAAACGPPGPKKYSEAKSRACLVAAQVKTQPPPASDFVANTALGGSFRANLPHNWVTVSFGDTVKNAASIDIAYHNVAAKNVRAGIDDVLRTNGNAVMLWHKHPNDRDLVLVQNCLRT